MREVHLRGTQAQWVTRRSRNGRQEAVSNFRAPKGSCCLPLPSELGVRVVVPTSKLPGMDIYSDQLVFGRERGLQTENKKLAWQVKG